MDKIFAEIFSRQPDEIINGDYFYYNSWYDDLAAISAKGIGKSLEKLRKERENQWRECTFIANWWCRTFQRKFDQYTDPWLVSLYETSKLNEIFDKIAADGKPVMDISSYNSGGFIPFILTRNPQIPCMATDIDWHLIKNMRLINSELTECEINLTPYNINNINLASFDNFDMPIKDNSLDYITSTFGISCSGSDIGNDKRSIYSRMISGKEIPINEVYRVLKPGGYFVTIESNEEWTFDMSKIYEECKLRGKILGEFTYDETADLQEKLKSPTWSNKFVEAGFEIELEEKYPEKEPVERTRTFLYMLSDTNRLTEKEKKTAVIRAESNKRETDKSGDDFGIEQTLGCIFYVLHKPD